MFVRINESNEILDFGNTQYLPDSIEISFDYKQFVDNQDKYKKGDSGRVLLDESLNPIDISDTDAYKLKVKQATNKEALIKRDNALDAFSNSLASNKIMLELGYITEAIYNSRVTEDKALVATAFAEFNTTLGITAPTIKE